MGMDIFGQGEANRQSSNDLVLKGSKGMWAPCWDGRAVIRFVPPVVDGKVQVVRESETDWHPQTFYAVPDYVKLAGHTTERSFLANVSDSKISPYDLLFSKLTAAAKQDDQFKNQLKKGERYSKLPKAAGGVIAQGILVYYKDKKMQTPRDVHFMLPKTARLGLKELMFTVRAPDDKSPFPPEDWRSKYAHPDVFDAKIGGTVLFEKFAEDVDGGGDLGDVSDVFSGGQGQMQAKKYTVKFMKTVPLPDKIIARCWEPWENAINRMSSQELIEQLCEIYPAVWMRFGLADSRFGQMLPAYVKSTKIGASLAQPEAGKQENLGEVQETAGTPQGQNSDPFGGSPDPFHFEDSDLPAEPKISVPSAPQGPAAPQVAAPLPTPTPPATDKAKVDSVMARIRGAISAPSAAA